MPERAASTPTPSRHRTYEFEINASLGNADRRPPFAHDTGQARAGGCRARSASSLPLAKHPYSGHRGLAATSQRIPASRQLRASQDLLRRSRRRVAALDFLL